MTPVFLPAPHSQGYSLISQETEQIPGYNLPSTKYFQFSNSIKKLLFLRNSLFHNLLMWIFPPILLLYLGDKGTIYFFTSPVRFIQKRLYFLSSH